MQALGMTNGVCKNLSVCEASLLYQFDSDSILKTVFLNGVWWNADTRASNSRAERRPGSHPGIPTSQVILKLRCTKDYHLRDCCKQRC